MPLNSPSRQKLAATGSICTISAHTAIEIFTYTFGLVIHSYAIQVNKATCIGLFSKPSSGLNLGMLVNIHISKNLKIKIYRTIILPVVLYGCET